MTVLAAQDLVVLQIDTEGANRFSVGDSSCDAAEGVRCILEVPTSLLEGGWNRLEVGSDRPVRGGPLLAQFHLGDFVFRRSCRVLRERDTGDLNELQLRLQCSFPDGFSGRLFGKPMEGGEALVPAQRLVLDLEGQGLGVDRPVARAEVPVEVVNGAGGRWTNPVGVAVPVPLVQLSVQGWADPWFEDQVSLKLRTEAGAELKVDGESFGTAARGRVRTVNRAVALGPNQLLVEAQLDGKVPAVERLGFQGKSPHTPLFINHPRSRDLEIREPRFRIEGQTLKGAKVYLGRRPIAVDRKGRFSLDLRLDEGRHEIELMAVMDVRRGRPARPPSFVHFVVNHVSRDLSPQASLWEKPSSIPMQDLLPQVAADPWAHQDAPVRLVAVVDFYASNLVGGRCQARALGLGCALEGVAPVTVAFRKSVGRTCVGLEFPIALQFEDCPNLKRGDRIRLAGRVDGGVGGVYEGYTLERSRIAVEVYEDWPWRGKEAKR